MIDVPSMFTVAPRGTVNEEILRETPIFFSSVSMDIGIVAFDVAVVKANIITGKNFLINLTGFSLVNTNSRIWYTPRHWINSARKTASMYFNIGTKASKPISAKVFAIRQKTPTGASFITVIVISIIMSLNCEKKLETVETFVPSFASITPTNSANTMIGSISPLAMEPIGFLGIMLSRVSTIAVGSAAVTSFCSTALRLTPMPGLISCATVSARVTAIMVVTR